ncbi:MAG: isoleucine--tRNA ligase [Phycisphaerales bacterium]|nr:isoleucine--tRNA ligase [Phycisphaerales bacterium]
MPETARDYRSTLNLPKTAFPMKANLAQAEPITVANWESEGRYDSLMKATAGAPSFVFHDGPPYANGAIHVGHMLNKVLKDFIVRGQIAAGSHCPYVPGWDCHGLPIEHKVMVEVFKDAKAEKLATLSDSVRRMAIRRECKASAEKFMGLQAKQMKRLLTLADYEHPYATMQPEYEAGTLENFATLVEQGLVFRQLKPIHWSIANRTALAEAELEYEDREDPSVFVDFEATDAAAVGNAFGAEVECTPSFMIWTTTPWTLPANLAIAVHPRLEYSLVHLDGALCVVASALLQRVVAAIGAESVKVIAVGPGANLVGLKYRHPFMDRESPVVAAEYVTTEDGTGLVHTAPGHGEDDYRTGRANGLEIYCPVQGDGTFDDTAPEWLRGKTVWEGNPLVIESLRQSGHLVHTAMFSHSYPHDWRSHTPVIFRTTEQWFIGVDRPMRRDGRTLRQAALESVEKSISFVPQWGHNRLRGMLESRPDWCISRQRSWGLPIPSFAFPDGSVLLTPASIRAVAVAVRARGSDAWFTEEPAELLATYDASKDPDAPEGLTVATLTKMYDIFDVWFEAGSSWHSVLRQRQLGFPSEVYLEGSDQHRGWFQLSMLPALGVTGRAPFNTLLTHGFIVDKDGRKMSKSLGNALEVEDLLKDFGADVCRWWVSSVAYDGDIRMDKEHVRLAGESYRKVRNTLRFLLSNLDGFTPAGELPQIQPTSLDAWALGELHRTGSEVTAAFRAYDFRAAHLAIFNFCNDTLSSIYCAAAKDRLYCDAKNAPRRRCTQAVMHECVRRLCALLWPILPHTAEEAWRALAASSGESATAAGVDMAAMLELGKSGSAGSSPNNSAPDARWPAVLLTRASVLRALESAKARGIENPLDAGVRIADPQGLWQPFAADLADLFGVSRVELLASGEGIEVTDLRSEPRCERSWRRDASVRTRSDGGVLSDRDAAAVGVV